MRKYIENRWILLFLLIPFFKPVYFQYNSGSMWVENLFVVWKIVSAAVILAMLFIYMWSYSVIPKITLFIFFFEASILLSTIYHQGYMQRAVIDGISMIAYAALLFLTIKYSCREMLKALDFLLTLLMLVNLASILIFPAGMPADFYINTENSLFFMTVDNGSALFLGFCSMIIIIDGMVNKKKISGRRWLLLGLCLLSAVLSQSVTAVITMLVIIFLGIFVLVSDLSRLQNPRVFIAIYIALIIYLFSMQENVISDFIMTNLFHRTGNFTGRYVLWEAAFNMIRIHPWLGYGRIEHDYIVAWGGYFSSHNYILEILLQGGILALLLFVFIVAVAVGRLYRMRHCRISTCLTFFLITILIAAMMESAVHSVYIFGVIIFCYYCRKLEIISWERNKK